MSDAQGPKNDDDADRTAPASEGVPAAEQAPTSGSDADITRGGPDPDTAVFSADGADGYEDDAAPGSANADDTGSASDTSAPSAAGAVGADELEEAGAQDASLQGKLSLLAARAALPTVADKEWAWDQLVGEHGRSNYELYALASGFWTGRHTDLVRPYVSRFHRDVPGLEGRVGQDALARVATLAYPRTVVEEATATATDEALAAGTLSPAVRRALVDQRAVLGEVLASRAAFGA